MDTVEYLETNHFDNSKTHCYSKQYSEDENPRTKHRVVIGKYSSFTCFFIYTPLMSQYRLKLERVVFEKVTCCSWFIFSSMKCLKRFSILETFNFLEFPIKMFIFFLLFNFTNILNLFCVLFSSVQVFIPSWNSFSYLKKIADIAYDFPPVIASLAS